MENHPEQGKPIKSIHFHDKLRELERRGHSIPIVVGYPGDPLRLVVRNQLVMHLGESLTKGVQTLTITGFDFFGRKRDALEITVLRVCRCNPTLVLVEGEEIHLLTEGIQLRYSNEQDTVPPHVVRTSANDIQYSNEQDTVPPHVVRSSSGSDSHLVPLLPASFDAQLRRIQQQADSVKEYPVIAVMDTGIDFRYPNTANLPTYFNPAPPTCDSFEPDYIGWDFINDHNYPYDDNESNKHGSRIAAIINRIAEGQVRIMPLKVIDSKGIGSLFAICCACEYLLAKPVRGQIKAVNASWGFYSREENRLLANYIAELAAQGTWFINAVGNRGDILENEIVDIGLFTRYPACYGGEVRHNVLTVTTVTNVLRFTVPGGIRTVYDVVENYSPTFTDIGVGSGKDGKFRESLVDDRTSSQIMGSSYASAYASGFAALLKPLVDDGKESFLQAIPANRTISSLTPRIRDGYVFIAETDPFFPFPLPE